MRTESDGPSRWARWCAYVACGWALPYAAYRGYYALSWLRFESCIVWSYFCVLDPRVAADIH